MKEWFFFFFVLKNSLFLRSRETVILLQEMEPWNYVSEGKGFESDERISPNNSLSRNKNALFGWQLRTTPCSFGNNMLISGGQQPVVDNQGFGELGSPEVIGKQLDNSMNEVLSCQFGGGRVFNQILAMPNAFSAEDHHSYSVSPKLSTSMVDSNSRVSTLFDLNLARLPDQNDGQNSNFSNGVPIFSSFESSTTAKRVRTSGLNSQTAFCQVYGCHKDLNSSKDYHKRHKVCEVHSKTPKVIVNGIEQRFCQQCSRFHLLAEFDEGKRSCRKRLAGHNERRRKPQVGIHSGRPGRLLRSFDDSDQGYQLGTTSFICQEILPSGLLYPVKYEADDWYRHVKVEDGTNYRHRSTFPATNGHLHSNSLFPQDIEKQYFHHFNDNGARTAAGNFFMENTVHYTHDNIGGEGPTPSSHSFFHNTSLGSEEYNVFDAATTVEGLSRIPDPARTGAHSLLSSQSQNSSSQQPAGIPMVRPLIMQSSHPRNGMGLFAEKFIGIRPQHSSGGDSNKIPLSGMNSTEENDHLGPILISDTADAVNFDGIFQEFDIWNSNDRHSSDKNGPNLEEHQMQSMQVTRENDSSCSGSLE